MKKHIWNLTPEDIVVFPEDGFYRWNRDFRKRQPMIGVVTIRELVAISDKKKRHWFIRGIEVEVVDPTVQIPSALPPL